MKINISVKKLKIEELLVALLVINAIHSITSAFIYFNFPYWIANALIPDVFDFSHSLFQLFLYISNLCVVIGVIKLIRQKKVKLVPEFYYPIFLHITLLVFNFIVVLLSTRFSYFSTEPNTHWTVMYLRIYNFILFGVIVYYFFTFRSRIVESETIEVSKRARLFNWIIDLTHIMALGFLNLRLLSRGSIFDDIEFMNSNPYWYFAIHIFIYYFILEFLFQQTIGKLLNKSFVVCQDNKLKSVFLRSISRFIPLEAFSFLYDNPGWHDRLSKTKVAIEKKA